MRTATPAKLPAWFEPYTYWRFVGLPREFPGSLAKFPRPAFPHRITRETQWVLDEWDRFALWAAWLDSRRKGPRPAGLWTGAGGKPVSPMWAVRTRRLVIKYRPGLPVPPPPFPIPPVHPYPDVSLGRNWIVMGENTEKALQYPARFGIMFTADIGVNDQGQKNYPWPSPALVKTLKDRGQRVRSWCDCHATFPDAAKKMAHDLGLDGWCGEGESAAAFQIALDAGADLALINLAALTGAQMDAIREGKIVTPNELYLNQDASRADRENWQNLPIPGRLVACYNAAGEASTGRTFPMSEYIALGKWNHGVDSFYDPGASDADRGLVK